MGLLFQDRDGRRWPRSNNNNNNTNVSPSLRLRREARRLEHQRRANQPAEEWFCSYFEALKINWHREDNRNPHFTPERLAESNAKIMRSLMEDCLDRS